MKKYYWYLLLFTLLSFFSTPALQNFCRSFLPFNFDNQILLTWKYSAVIGQFPYRDIFYPYGFLSFYKDSILFFSILDFLIVPALFVGIYFILKKALKDKFVSIFALLLIYLFILKFTGFDNFGRYGSFVLYSCFVGYVFYFLKDKFLKVGLFFLGVVSGLVFFLYNDQGVYSVVLFFVFLTLKNFKSARTTDLQKIAKTYFLKLSYFILGLIISLLPFFIILYLNNSINSFFNSFFDVVDLEKLAKTPFFHNIFSFEIILVLSMLVLTAIYLSYLYLTNKKLGFINYLQIMLFLCLIILEQKSIVRHNEGQFSFVAILLLLFLLHEIIHALKINLINYKVLLNLGSVFFLIIIISQISFPNFSQINKRCYQRFEIKQKLFFDIKNSITTMNDFNGKIFTFPEDEYFYIVFDQRPPYYPSSFEASSEKAQTRLVEYINVNEIKYIIYNYKNLAVQDSVPNVIRSPILESFIFNNFFPIKKIGNYIILKRGNSDFMQNSVIEATPELKSSLLSVQLKSVPNSEGFYKSNILQSEKFKPIILGNINQVNNTLEKQSITSNQLFLYVSFLKVIKNVQLSITTREGYSTQIYFDCTKMCIINLNKLPLFYKNRIIISLLSEDEEQIEKIGLYKQVKDSTLW